MADNDHRGFWTGMPSGILALLLLWSFPCFGQAQDHPHRGRPEMAAVSPSAPQKRRAEAMAEWREMQDQLRTSDAETRKNAYQQWYERHRQELEPPRSREAASSPSPGVAKTSAGKLAAAYAKFVQDHRDPADRQVAFTAWRQSQAALIGAAQAEIEDKRRVQSPGNLSFERREAPSDGSAAAQRIFEAEETIREVMWERSRQMAAWMAMPPSRRRQAMQQFFSTRASTLKVAAEAIISQQMSKESVNPRDQSPSRSKLPTP